MLTIVDHIRCSPMLFIIPLLWSGFVQASLVPMETPESIRRTKSEEMLKYLNKSADPCENFYNFACGQWPTIHPASKMKYETNVFQNTKDDLERKILSLLQNSTNSKNESRAEKNVKHFYESCLNAGTASYSYADKLRSMLQEFGKMPALAGNSWREADFDWLTTIADIARKYNINIILGYTIKVDLEENTVNRLFITHPDFPLKSLAMYLDKANDMYRENYRQVIAGNLKEFLNISTDLSEQVAKEILDFEIGLVKGTQRYTVRGKELHFATTVEKLHRLHQPELDIKRLLDLSLGQQPTGRIIVKNPGYQTGLIDLLQKTPKKIVANYIFYNLITHFLLPIDKSAQKLQAKCMEKTKGNFANILDNMVYRQYNTNQTEQAVQNIFLDLKANFQLALESGKYSWINETTRKLAVDKLKAMRLEINSYNHLNFSEEYGNLILNTNTDYIENLQNIFQVNAAKSRTQLGKIPKSYYDGAGMSFGPRYILTENCIKIPVASLQPYHFWSAAHPQAVNYGRLGFLIGHEMIHGFDDEGRTFDKLGNDRDWWDANSAQHFNDRTTCFREQYRNYAPSASKKSSQQSENIADNGGIRLAYETFTSWEKNVKKSPHLTALEMLPDFPNYSGKQLFFISFAQLWCYDILPEVRSIKFANDAHEPGHLRVVGSLSNFHEFSQAFNCPQGSAMNPSKKCEIF